MKRAKYKQEIEKLDLELAKLQETIGRKGMKVAIVFEGRDAAGKGGLIKTITRRMNARVWKVVALPKPSEEERTQWYFQRYVEHLPAAGEIVLFDRSWYNRAVVEPVMEFCTDEEYERFMAEVNEFEKMIVNSGVILLKYWLHVSAEEQERRFIDRANNPFKRWKLSAIDLEGRRRWADFTKARDRMLDDTSSKHAPWRIVDADNKKKARLNAIRSILSEIPYEFNEKAFAPLKLPPRPTPKEVGYDERSIDQFNMIKDHY